VRCVLVQVSVGPSGPCTRAWLKEERLVLLAHVAPPKGKELATASSGVARQPLTQHASAKRRRGFPHWILWPEPESSLPMNGRQRNERPPHVQELPYRQITTRQFDVRTLHLEPDPDRRGVRMGVLSNHYPLDFSPLGFVR
jgi:hypothetical protein